LRLELAGASVPAAGPGGVWGLQADVTVLYEYRYETADGALGLIATIPVATDHDLPGANRERQGVTDAMARGDADAAPGLGGGGPGGGAGAAPPAPPGPGRGGQGGVGAPPRGGATAAGGGLAGGVRRRGGGSRPAEPGRRRDVPHRRCPAR